MLTAAHVVAGAVAVAVRGPDKVAHPADLDTALIGDPDNLDLALLAVPAAPPLSGVAVALVDRDVATGEVIEGCWSVGYPSFQEVARDAAGSVRETAQVRGWIPPLSGLVEGLLSLEVTATPQPLPAEQTGLGQSEWSGMSGAAVFAGEALVGVVTEHAPRRGSSGVTVTPTGAPDRAGHCPRRRRGLVGPARRRQSRWVGAAAGRGGPAGAGLPGKPAQTPWTHKGAGGPGG